MEEAPQKKRRTEEVQEECAICLDAISATEKAKQLECGHGSFHVNCIELWDMEREDPNCPLCRTPFKPRISQFERIEHSIECSGCSDACALMMSRIAKTMVHSVRNQSDCERCDDCSFVFDIVNAHGAECDGCDSELCKSILTASRAAVETVTV